MEWGEKNHDTIGLGQIVEKPRGDLDKVLPRFAFGISRGIQILPRGNFFQISPKAFPQSVRLWFSRGARISPKGPLWKNLGKPAVRSVHSKSQIALIENQSLSQSAFCKGCLIDIFKIKCIFRINSV